MRGWEREPGEGDRAFECFKVYRDMPDRSLRKVAERIYGETSESNLRTLKRWSAKFDWQDRIAAHEARDAMIAREAVEEHIREGAADRARREAKLLEESLELREQALTQAKLMLRAPLYEQKRLVEGPDGEEVTYQFFPARWSKSTAIALYGMATQGNARPEDLERGMIADYSHLEDEELEQLLGLMDKVEWVTPPEQGR
jgi:hypothetical protein